MKLGKERKNLGKGRNKEKIEKTTKGSEENK